jgi:hypothetical protein
MERDVSLPCSLQPDVVHVSSHMDLVNVLTHFLMLFPTIYPLVFRVLSFHFACLKQTMKLIMKECSDGPMCVCLCLGRCADIEWTECNLVVIYSAHFG